MNPLVVWTHRAERRLYVSLLRTAGSAAGLAEVTADLGGRLAAAFPAAATVIVLELLVGFRTRPGEYILLVDIRDPDRPGTCIAKLACDDRLRPELEAWVGCRPPGLTLNPVFMALDPRYLADDPTRLVALIYRDAQQNIGSGESAWLETATVQAVRFGAPDPASVVAVLRDLFHQLGRVLYDGSRVERPAGQRIELNPDRQRGGRLLLADALDRWEARPAAVATRQEVGAAFPVGLGDFLDPVDYFRYLEAELADGWPPGDVLPSVLRGRAHGDLHGQNVLVGVDQNRAEFPAVYDYEHVSADNLIGWDFVELETELKVRAYEAVFAGRSTAAFVDDVRRAEVELAERTRAGRDGECWPAGPDPPAAGSEPPARLAAVVLAIRRLASVRLGRDRPGEWLAEYQFLLACYGLNTVWYDNQTDRQRATVFVSAGVAAAEYESGRV